MTCQTTKRTLFSLGLIFVFTLYAGAQSSVASNETAIITAMKDSENDWNKGDLNSFMKMYIETSTMMMPTGPVGLSAIRDLYQNHYFNGTIPKQHLYYDELKVTMPC